MPTFSDIKQPTGISQTTYIELISAHREIITPSTGTAYPDVAASLPALAFRNKKKTKRGTKPATATPTTTPATYTQTTTTTPSYNITSTPQLYRMQAGVRYTKESAKLRSLITNEIVTQAFGPCPAGTPCTDPCTPLPSDKCLVDLAVCLDDTGSMGGAARNIAAGIQKIGDILKSAVGQNFRMSLITFEDQIHCETPFSTLCGDASLAAFKSSVDYIVSLYDLHGAKDPVTGKIVGGYGHDNGGDFPEWSAAAVMYSVKAGDSLKSIGAAPYYTPNYGVPGEAGCWRSGDVIRLILLVTDFANNPGSGISAQQAADAATACGIKILYVAATSLSKLPLMDDINAYMTTGGIWVSTNSSGEDLDTLLTSYLLSLCAETVPTAECEGGTNKILNGTFNTNVAGWIDLTTLPGRNMQWSTDTAMELTGAASQFVTGIEPKDRAILYFDVWTDTTPEAFTTPDTFCQVGFTQITKDNWNTTGEMLAWAGSGASILTFGAQWRLYLTAVNVSASTDSVLDKYYTSDGTRITTIDNNGVRAVIYYDSLSSFIDLQFDPINKRLYMVDSNAKRIVRIDHDGKNPITIQEFESEGKEIYGIALDAQRQAIFCALTTGRGVTGAIHEIRAIDLSSNGLHTDITTPSRTPSAAPLKIKIVNRTLYWVASSDVPGMHTHGVVERGFYNSNAVQKLWETNGAGGNAPAGTVGSIEGASGIDVTANNTETYIYVAAYGKVVKLTVGTLGIVSASSNLTTLTAWPNDLLYDAIAGRIAVATAGSIIVCELNGATTTLSTTVCRAIEKASQNAAVASKTFTGLTPGDTVSFSVNIDSVTSNSDLMIQLMDGTTKLAEASWHQGATSFAAEASRPLTRPLTILDNIVRPRIVNGTVIDNWVHPEVGIVGVYVDADTFIPVGTGTLISGRHVLTAAHCTYNYANNGGVITVTALPDNAASMVIFDSPTTYRHVRSRKIFRHPGWNQAACTDGSLLNKDTTNDIAIIELESDLSDLGLVYPKISSATFEGGGPAPMAGNTVTLYGYGHDTFTEPGTFGVKRTGTTVVEEVTSTLIRWTYQEGETTTEEGDSGGPQYYHYGTNDYIISVVSGGPTLDTGIGTYFNTKVAAYDIWIYNIINGPQIEATVPASGQVTANIRLIPDPGDQGAAYLEYGVVCYKPSTVSGNGQLDYQLKDDLGTVLAYGTVLASDLQPPGKILRPTISADVPSSGEIEVVFDAQNGDIAPFKIDNVVLCVLKVDDCGPGLRNAITNGNFETGVQGWTDATNIQLTPTDDAKYWDGSIQAIISSMTGSKEIRTLVTGLVPDSGMTLDFELASLTPTGVPELQITYGVLDSLGVTQLAYETVAIGDLPAPPTRLQLYFSVPANGEVIIFIKGGDITTTGGYSGLAKIRNVLLCSRSAIPACDEGYTKLSFTDCTTDKGAWSGGTHNAVDGTITLNNGEYIRQTFTGITIGSKFQLAFTSVLDGSTAGTYQIEFVHGPGKDQFNTSSSGGIKVYEITTQSTSVTVTITNIGGAAADIDNILICTKEPLTCDGSITNLKARMQWRGEPRQPINIFNAIARYVVRDPNDIFSTTVITHIPDSEGHAAGSTCDLWKQMGNGGKIESTIMRQNLTTSLVDGIETGDSVSIASGADKRSNWVWSIPRTGTAGQDSLVVSFPPPPPGIIESVTVMLLANRIEPLTTNPAPTNPPPLACVPDPAEEFEVSITYTNNIGLNKQFSVAQPISDMLEQTAELNAPHRWDESAPIDYGLSGDTARWEGYEFVLDSPAGDGLDQCFPAVMSSASGQGTLNFGEFYIAARGSFVDPCQAYVEIVESGTGATANEVQSIGIPPAISGTFDISLTYQGVTDTTTVSYGATADTLKQKLAELSQIGTTSNLEVTGTGTILDPYVITFVAALAGTSIPLLIVDSNNLVGSSTAYVTTISDGTSNARQTIFRSNEKSTANFTITYAGKTTVPLKYNASLNAVQTQLETLTSIGSGNVLVTGDISDKNANYSGPWYVDFINGLGNKNVAVMSVTPSTDYSVYVDWSGGPGGGVNETQLIHVSASDGTFTLDVYSPDEQTYVATIETAVESDPSVAVRNEEQWVAPAIQKQYMAYNLERIGTVSGGTFDLSIDGTVIVDIPYDITLYDLYRIFWDGGILRTTFNVDGGPTGVLWDSKLSDVGLFALNFIGSARYNYHAILIDDTNLTGGGDYVVTSTIMGTGTATWAMSGIFRLRLANPDDSSQETTGDIKVRASAAEVKSALETLPSIGVGNVDVIAYDDGVVVVEYIGDLAGVDMTKELKMSTSNLPTGATAYINSTSRPGYSTSDINEAQTISIAGNLTGGTFTLTFNGETTGPIPYNATATVMQVALEALPSSDAGDFIVTKSGDVWTVEFAGQYAGTDVAFLVADTSLITGDPTYYTVGPLSFNATASEIAQAMVDTVPFLTVNDVLVEDVTRDIVNNTYEWQVTFGGQHARKDFPQMTIDYSLLDGAGVVVSEVVAGSGATELQRLTIRNTTSGRLGTSGNFKLTVTADGQTATTDSIIWDTTAAGLQEQLQALPMFIDIPGAVLVTDLGTGGDPTIVSQFEIEFAARFGNIPAMFSPDAAENLRCASVAVNPVDAGPYPYPIPKCDEIDQDLSCQSGPLLCRPGDGSAPTADTICCTPDTIPESVDIATTIRLERDLFDPSQIYCKDPLTILELMLRKGLKPSDYNVYLRNFQTNTLSPVQYNNSIVIGQSVVLIETGIDSIGRRADILQQIRNNEILPSRMVW